VDGNGRVSETVEDEGGLLPKGEVIKSVLLESDMGEIDDREDFNIESQQCCLISGDTKALTHKYQCEKCYLSVTSSPRESRDVSIRVSIKSIILLPTH
jgi:hypothetical protein